MEDRRTRDRKGAKDRGCRDAAPECPVYQHAIQAAPAVHACVIYEIRNSNKHIVVPGKGALETRSHRAKFP